LQWRRKLSAPGYRPDAALLPLSAAGAHQRFQRRPISQCSSSVFRRGELVLELIHGGMGLLGRPLALALVPADSSIGT